MYLINIHLQGRLRLDYNQQSWWSHLPARFHRGIKQAQHKRLPRPRWNISRVTFPPSNYLLPTILSLSLFVVIPGLTSTPPPPRVHAITTRLHPLPSAPSASTPSLLIRPDPPSGIEVLETENFRLQCFSTLTGTKFLLFTEPMQPNVERILQRVYELYADYVMKNPFYQMEMPVRCEGWERRLVGEMRVINSGR